MRKQIRKRVDIILEYGEDKIWRRWATEGEK
jgi:hypothetical protein